MTTDTTDTIDIAKTDRPVEHEYPVDYVLVSLALDYLGGRPTGRMIDWREFLELPGAVKTLCRADGRPRTERREQLIAHLDGPLAG